MSRVNEVYEDLKEYIEVVRGRIIEYEDGTDLEDYGITEEQAEYQKSVWLTVEEELERILDGRGL